MVLMEMVHAVANLVILMMMKTVIVITLSHKSRGLKLTTTQKTP